MGADECLLLCRLGNRGECKKFAIEKDLRIFIPWTGEELGDSSVEN